ncbi:hypothetical protein GCM10009771_13000 [Nesterenkonia flava]
MGRVSPLRLFTLKYAGLKVYERNFMSARARFTVRRTWEVDAAQAAVLLALNRVVSRLQVTVEVRLGSPDDGDPVILNLSPEAEVDVDFLEPLSEDDAARARERVNDLVSILEQDGTATITL